MLYLLFHLNADCYALDVRAVVEVLPLLTIKTLPRAPRGVAGLFNFRGAPVPAIDLSALSLDRPAAPLLSTRLVLVHFRDNRGGPRLLGLIAERVTETLRLEAADFEPTGVSTPEAPYLGPVARQPRGLIQRVEIDQLLPSSVQAVLFQEARP